jgi:hypothetical protein
MARIVNLDDGNQRPSRRQMDAGVLFDFAKAKPKGFTYDDVEATLGWGRNYFYSVVRELRLQLAEDDTINLPCQPQGWMEPWLYRLVGTHDDCRIWNKNRVDDMVARFETMEAVAHSIGKQKVDSFDRRRARKIERTLSYLRGELQELA